MFPYKHDKRDLKAINYLDCTEQLLIMVIYFCARNFAGIKNLCRTVQVLQLTIGERKEVIPE